LFIYIWFSKPNNHYLICFGRPNIAWVVISSKNRFNGEFRKYESGFDVEFEVLQRKELEPFHEDHLGLIAKMFVDED